MGYYIELPDGGHFRKAEWLIKEHGAVEVTKPPPWLENAAIICVVNNGTFEAAGYAYSPAELNAFSYPDNRKRRWLVMDKVTARKLSGYNRE